VNIDYATLNWNQIRNQAIIQLYPDSYRSKLLVQTDMEWIHLLDILHSLFPYKKLLRPKNENVINLFLLQIADILDLLDGDMIELDKDKWRNILLKIAHKTLVLTYDASV
jgi:hypothetical protein